MPGRCGEAGNTLHSALSRTFDIDLQWNWRKMCFKCLNINVPSEWYSVSLKKLLTIGNRLREREMLLMCSKDLENVFSRISYVCLLDHFSQKKELILLGFTFLIFIRCVNLPKYP